MMHPPVETQVAGKVPPGHPLSFYRPQCLPFAYKSSRFALSPLFLFPFLPFFASDYLSFFGFLIHTRYQGIPFFDFRFPRYRLFSLFDIDLDLCHPVFFLGGYSRRLVLRPIHRIVDTWNVRLLISLLSCLRYRMCSCDIFPAFFFPSSGNTNILL